MATKALTAAQQRDKELFGAPLDSVLRSAAPNAREIAAATYPSKVWALARIAWLLWPEAEYEQLRLQPNGAVFDPHDARWYEMLERYFAIRHGNDSWQFRQLTDQDCIDVLLADMAAAESGKKWKRKGETAIPELTDRVLICKKRKWLLDVPEAAVLQVIIRRQAVDKDTLIRESNVPNAPRIVKRMIEKYPCPKGWLTMPGGKGKGGYTTKIR